MHSYGDSLGLIINLILLLQFFGSSVSYVVAYSGLLDLIYSVIFNNNYSIYTYLAIAIYTIIVMPLSLFRSMSKLRFTSFLGASCSIYLSLVIFIEYFVLCKNEYLRGEKEEIFSTCFWSSNFNKNVLKYNFIFFSSNNIFDIFIGFITTFPLNCFAFTCHPYMLPVYIELKNRNINKMRIILFRSILIAIFIYFTISLFSYLLFLNKTCGNVLTNNFNKHIDIIIACLAISISCILTLPIYSFTFRCSFGELIWGIKQLPTVKHIIITIIFGATSVIIGISVSSISIVFGILGSTTYPLLGNILPTIFFIKLIPKNKYKFKKKIAIIQAIFVSIISITSLFYKLYQIIKGENLDKDCAWKQRIRS